MNEELKVKLNKMIDNEVDGVENDPIMDKNLSITDNGLNYIESNLTKEDVITLNTLFADNFVSVRSLFKMDINIDGDFLKALTQDYTNFNGYIWRKDAEDKNIWVATYYDLLTALEYNLYSNAF